MEDHPITLITGTRKGIGKFLVGHFLEQGHTVIGCSRSAPDWTAEGYHHLLADVTDEKAVSEVLRFVRKNFGRLDNLINNAGIASMNHCLLTPADTALRIVNTNLIGTFLFCREGAKLMQKNHYGRIVNFTTVAVPLRLSGEAMYAASKAAVISLSQILANEFAPYGITVNAIGPTPIDTDLIRAVPQEKLDKLLARQAIGRFGTFDDVANVIDFYLRKESSFITGQTIFLGGV